MRTQTIAIVAALFAFSAGAATSLPIAPRAIDRTVARAMQEFEVPGMAVGIVKDGKVVYAKGYGVREHGKPERVGVDTLFQIGSNTKAFTAAALSLAGRRLQGCAAACTMSVPVSTHETRPWRRRRGISRRGSASTRGNCCSGGA